MANSNELKEAQKDVHLWLKRKEMLWKQRSRVLWLKEGDKNFKFFHAQDSTRKCINIINLLRNSEGTLLKGSQLEAHIVDYF